MSYSNSFSVSFYHSNFIKYDLLTKFNYRNIYQVPIFRKIVLSFVFKETNLKNFLQAAAVLELITGQKMFISKSRTPSISLKLRKGSPVGCKVVLRKKALIGFISKLILIIFPNINVFNGIKLKKKKNELNSFSFSLSDLSLFPELESQYEFFQNLPKLNISIVLSSKTSEEVSTVLTSYRFPLN